MQNTLFELGSKSPTTRVKQAELSHYLATEFAPLAGKSAVVRETGVGFEGKVITRNTLPSQTGSSLWNAMQGPYKGAHEQLLNKLIDEHITGLVDISRVDWSALKEATNVPPWLAILCYCHPGAGYERNQRKEEYWVLSSDNPIRLRWIYQIEEMGMRIICTSFEKSDVEEDIPALKLKLAGRDFFLPFCVVERKEIGFWRWDGPQPIWGAIEAMGEKMNLWRLTKRAPIKVTPSSDQLSLLA